MTLAILILVALILLLEMWRSWPRPTDRLLKQHLHDRYVITVGSGDTFSGLLAEVDGATLTLRDVRVLKLDGTSTQVDGDILLRRDSISYMQKPT